MCGHVSLSFIGRLSIQSALHLDTHPADHPGFVVKTDLVSCNLSLAN
jgi:hypothetical protein